MNRLDGRVVGAAMAALLALMKRAIAINASFFNTHRVVHQDVDHAYAVEDGIADVG